MNGWVERNRVTKMNVGKAHRVRTSIDMVIYLGANTSMRVFGQALSLRSNIRHLCRFMLSETMILVSIGLAASPPLK